MRVVEQAWSASGWHRVFCLPIVYNVIMAFVIYARS